MKISKAKLNQSFNLLMIFVMAIGCGVWFPGEDKGKAPAPDDQPQNQESIQFSMAMSRSVSEAVSKNRNSENSYSVKLLQALIFFGSVELRSSDGTVLSTISGPFVFDPLLGQINPEVKLNVPKDNKIYSVGLLGDQSRTNQVQIMMDVTNPDGNGTRNVLIELKNLKEITFQLKAFNEEESHNKLLSYNVNFESVFDFSGADTDLSDLGPGSGIVKLPATLNDKIIENLGKKTEIAIDDTPLDVDKEVVIEETKLDSSVVSPIIKVPEDPDNSNGSNNPDSEGMDTNSDNSNGNDSRNTPSDSDEGDQANNSGSEGSGQGQIEPDPSEPVIITYNKMNASLAKNLTSNLSIIGKLPGNEQDQIFTYWSAHNKRFVALPLSEYSSTNVNISEGENSKVLVQAYSGNGDSITWEAVLPTDQGKVIPLHFSGLDHHQMCVAGNVSSTESQKAFAYVLDGATGQSVFEMTLPANAKTATYCVVTLNNIIVGYRDSQDKLYLRFYQRSNRIVLWTKEIETFASDSTNPVNIIGSIGPTSDRVYLVFAHDKSAENPNRFLIESRSITNGDFLETFWDYSVTGGKLIITDFKYKDLNDMYLAGISNTEVLGKNPVGGFDTAVFRYNKDGFTDEITKTGILVGGWGDESHAEIVIRGANFRLCGNYQYTEIDDVKYENRVVCSKYPRANVTYNLKGRVHFSLDRLSPLQSMAYYEGLGIQYFKNTPQNGQNLIELISEEF